MKKVLIIVLSLIVVLLLGILIFFNVTKEDTDKYEEVTIEGYIFNVLDSYDFEYNNDENYGYFKNKMFIKSYIFLANQSYSTLIRSSSYYHDMGSEERESTTEEKKYGDFDVFINNKVVYYDDNDKENNLVVILIKVRENKTFVVQYEVDNSLEVKTILENIEKGLMEIKKK